MAGGLWGPREWLQSHLNHQSRPSPDPNADVRSNSRKAWRNDSWCILSFYFPGTVRSPSLPDTYKSVGVGSTEGRGVRPGPWTYVNVHRFSITFSSHSDNCLSSRSSVHRESSSSCRFLPTSGLDPYPCPVLRPVLWRVRPRTGTGSVGLGYECVLERRVSGRRPVVSSGPGGPTCPSVSRSVPVSRTPRVTPVCRRWVGCPGAPESTRISLRTPVRRGRRPPVVSSRCPLWVGWTIVSGSAVSGGPVVLRSTRTVSTSRSSSVPRASGAPGPGADRDLVPLSALVTSPLLPGPFIPTPVHPSVPVRTSYLFPRRVVAGDG